MKKIFKKLKLRDLLFFIIGGVVIGTVGITANTYLLQSNEIQYTNDKSVQQAIDELFIKAENCGGSNEVLPIGTINVEGYQMTIPYTGSYQQAKCIYGTDENYGSEGTINNNTCKITGTSANQKLYYKIVATNITSSAAVTIYENSGSATTGTENVAPTNMSLSSNSDTTYSKTKSVTVTLKDTGGSGLASGSVKYGWSTSTSTAPSSYTTVNTSSTTGTNTTTFTASGSGLTGSYYLWVVPVTYKDKEGNSNTTTVKSTGTFNFDNTAPTLTLGTVTTTKSSINIPYTANDSDSGIDSTICVAGTSTSNYNKTGTISNNICTISGLSANTKYYYKVTTTDKVGKSTSKTGNKTTATGGLDCSEGGCFGFYSNGVRPVFF